MVLACQCLVTYQIVFSFTRKILNLHIFGLCMYLTLIVARRCYGFDKILPLRFGWLVNRSIGQLVGWSVGRSVDQSVSQSVTWSVGHSVG